MPLKAVFFDLDGTLLDTAPDFVLTLNQLAREYQVPTVSEKLIRQTVSDGARALTTLLFGLPEGEAGFNERRLRLLDIYYEHMGKQCALYDGMYELLTNINQYRLSWGIITNKPERFAKPIVNNLSLPATPDILICPDHVTHSKPHAEPILKACRFFGYQPDEIIYIGDHKRDIDCGINAGCETIAVRFGYIHEGDDIDNWQATHVVAHSNDIWPLLKQKLNHS